MNYKIKVVANKENGEIVQQNPNKPEYGSIRFDQEGFIYSGNFLSLKNKVCFTHGKLDELRKFSELMELKDGLELPGVLYILERREPFYPEQEPKINPLTGCVVLIDGAPVYRNCYYDRSGTNPDQLILGVKSIGPILESWKKKNEDTLSFNTSSLGN